MQKAIDLYGTEPFPSYGQPDDHTILPPVIRGLWQGGESFMIDTVSGKLATEYTPPETRKEYVIPNPKSILSWIDKANPRKLVIGGIPDPQKNRWDQSVISWVNNHGMSIDTPPIKPTEYDNVHTADTVPQVVISGITNNQTIDLNTPIEISVSGSSVSALKDTEIFINNQSIAVSETHPASFNITFGDTGIVPGNYIIKIITRDILYNRSQQEFSVVLR
jgi:hypothetical protein